MFKFHFQIKQTDLKIFFQICIERNILNILKFVSFLPVKCLIKVKKNVLFNLASILSCKFYHMSLPLSGSSVNYMHE